MSHEYPKAGPVRITSREGKVRYEQAITKENHPNARIVGPGDTLEWWHDTGRGPDSPEALEALKWNRPDDFGSYDWALDDEGRARWSASGVPVEEDE